MAQPTPRASGSSKSQRAKDRAVDSLRAKIERIQSAVARIDEPPFGATAEEFSRAFTSLKKAISEA